MDDLSEEEMKKVKDAISVLSKLNENSGPSRQVRW